MSPTNHAAWLTAKQSPVFSISTAPYTSPSANQLVIKTRAIAINPADWMIQKLGIVVTSFPAILGCDVAGEVVEVHPSLADTYIVGDRVIGSIMALERKDDVYCYSGFQEYVVLRSPSIVKIPKTLPFEEAVVFPLAMNTAACGLFPQGTLGLQVPSIDDAVADQGKTLLVWGASSSVGCSAVQLAVQAGYEVVGVASQKNHEMVKSLGVSMCFDHHSPTIVDEIVAYLHDKEVVGAYGAISTVEILATLCEILEKTKGRKKVSSVMPGGETHGTKGVEIANNSTIFKEYLEGGIAKSVWEWLGKAMEEKKVRCMPPPEVVGNGLEELQKATDLLAQGVSAKKLVVTI